MCKRGALQAATLVESAFLWVMAKDTGEAATAMGKGWHLHSLSFRSLIMFCVCMPSITCQASPQQLEPAVCRGGYGQADCQTMQSGERLE